MLGVLSMPEFDKGELHIHTDVKDIEKVYAMINQAGLNSTQDTVHFLPFWENVVNICNIHIYKKRISYLVWYEMRFFSVENQNSPLFFI